jgi:Ca2+-binding EF-hand superfamily protein
MVFAKPLGVTMKTALTIALLLGAAVMGSASAQSTTGQTEGPMQGLERSTERGAERLLRQFDLNKDGKVGRDEMNRTIGFRFATATHHAPGMSVEQFIAARAAEFRAANDAMFHRLDWNGDGKLTLAEYAAPQHIRFVELDRTGAGYVFCGVADPTARSGRAGLAGFCRENDLDMDGRVMRAELDQAIAKRFNAGAGKSQSMTLAQFIASEEQRYLPVNVRLFRRLDQDGDGLLTIQEYASAEAALFARLDKNGNGVLEPTELHPRAMRMAHNDK